MPQAPDSLPTTRRKSGTEPLRRRRPAPAPAAALWRRPLQLLLVFVTVVLLIDALVGERGLVERMKAGRLYLEAQAELEKIRQENARLLEEARRLKEDSSAIESLARRDLGLLRPGEILFIIKDIKPAQ
jgi:cell division protein FtsB